MDALNVRRKLTQQILLFDTPLINRILLLSNPEEYYAQFGMTLEEGVALVNDESGSEDNDENTDTDAQQDQTQGDDVVYLAEFLKKNFLGDIRAVDLPINIAIDPNLPKGDNGWTWRTKKNTIEMRISKSIMKDPNLLYVTLAHEFVHAIDFNPGGYYDHFYKLVENGPDKSNIMLAIGEYHAYTVSSRLAIAYGTDLTNGDRHRTSVL